MNLKRSASAFSRRVCWVLAILLLPSGLVQAQCVTIPGCTLVWSDEFDGSEVDLGKWTFQLGDGSEVGLPSGWGNNELQYYTADNTTVSDGMLTIEARNETVASGFLYSSARLRSRFKGDWTYGRFEMRAKMPVGKGLWPAFWMLPSETSIYGTWAASGEIDIMEYVGSEPSRIFGTLHYGDAWPNNVFTSNEYELESGTFNDNFHEYAIEWDAQEIRWYIDGEEYARQDDWFTTAGPFPAPFDINFHLLLNLAVGGNLPGSPSSETVFPQQLVIDYVRVYQAPLGGVFNINYGLSGGWFSPETSGQGLLLEVLPDSEQVFVTWFTYEAASSSKVGAPEHRWLSGLGSIDGNRVEVDLRVTSGGLFDDPVDVSRTEPGEYGTLTLEFADCANATMNYNLTAEGLAGSRDLIRLSAPPQACLDLAESR